MTWLISEQTLDKKHIEQYFLSQTMLGPGWWKEGGRKYYRRLKKIWLFP
jgi:hypothetical protein